MAKNSITDYSKTASLNTDIQSVDIDENCLPSGINNAIRELMSDLADVNDGTVSLTSPAFAAATIAGDLTVDTNTLHVDSTNNRVGIGTSSPSAVIHAYENSGSATILGRFENPSGEAIVEIKSQNDALSILQFADSEDGNVGAVQYSHPDNSMRFKTNDAERMRIDSSGNVGIGTTSPDTQLHVSKSSVSGTSYDSNDLITIENNGFAAINMISSASTASTLIFSDATRAVGLLQYNHSDNSMRFNTNGSERLRIDSSGNVGIGTTSPTNFGGGFTTLEIQDSTAGILKLGFDAQTNVGSRIQAQNDQGLKLINTEPSAFISFTTVSTERMRIDSSGNVGIGTSSPSEKLEINGNLRAFSAGYPLIDIGISTSNYFRLIHDNPNDLFQIGKNGAGTLKITGSGNVIAAGNLGIGTSSPIARLDVESGQGKVGFNYGTLSSPDRGNLWYDTDGTGWRFNIGKVQSGSFTSQITIQDSGNVGIGTSSPLAGYNLSVGDGSVAESASVNINGGSNSAKGSGIRFSKAGTAFGFIGAASWLEGGVSNDLAFSGNSSASVHMRIDSSGRVGIGTSSPAAQLHVQNSSGNSTSILGQYGTGTRAEITAFANQVELRAYNGTNDIMTFKTGSSERMRIDSSGNLLVGQSSTIVPGLSNTTTGLSLTNNGYIFASKADDNVAWFNRNTSDGSIVSLRKNGTTVGQIGTTIGNAYFAGSSTGITFGSANVYPTNSSGTKSNGTLTLGSSSNRFKDLYLGGGVYLGGTGDANKLEDYEEGTFGGTQTGSVYSGTYTKVGRIVHISMSIDNSGSTANSIGILPFTSKNGGTSFNGAHPTFNASYSAYDNMYVAPYNGGAVLFAYTESGNTIGTVASGQLTLNFVYETDA